MADGGDEYQDEFDHQVNAVLATEEELLQRKTAEFLATGSVAIARPGGVIRGSIERPRWWRRGTLRIWSESPDGVREASSEVRLEAGRPDQVQLENSIAINLAMHIVRVDA